jgi:hypothetical protein
LDSAFGAISKLVSAFVETGKIFIFGFLFNKAFKNVKFIEAFTECLKIIHVVIALSLLFVKKFKLSYIKIKLTLDR